MSLARVLAPLPEGEERLTYYTRLPGVTPGNILRAILHRMTEMMEDQLARTPWIAEVRMPPTILKETVTGDGVDVVHVHVEAHIVRTEASKQAFRTVGEQQADDQRRTQELMRLVADPMLSREDLLRKAAEIGFEAPDEDPPRVGEFYD